MAFCHTVTAGRHPRRPPERRARNYYFAVTAYSYNPSGKPKVLETVAGAGPVMPQRPALGTDPATASASDVTYLRMDTRSRPHGRGHGQGGGPERRHRAHLQGHLQPTERPPFTGQVGADTATVLYAWSLHGLDDGEVLLSGQLNRRGDADYRVVDGIQVVEVGKYFPNLQDVSYLNNNTTHRRALEGVNFGLTYFGGGADYGYNFFGSTLDPFTMPDSFTTVEVRFSHTATQKAYRFVRMQTVTGAAPASYPNRGYLNRGFLRRAVPGVGHDQRRPARRRLPGARGHG